MSAKIIDLKKKENPSNSVENLRINICHTSLQLMSLTVSDLTVNLSIMYIHIILLENGSYSLNREGGGRVVRWCWVNFQCQAPYNFDYSRARAYCACSRCGWGWFGHFYSNLSFVFFLPLFGRRPDIE